MTPDSTASSSTSSRLLKWALAAIALLCGGALIGWAIAAVLVVPRAGTDEPSFTYVDVVEGDVGSSLNLNSVARWAPLVAGANRATGTVTSVSLAAGSEAQSGDLLFAVDLRPVVVAVGEVPMFRDLQNGTRGKDVAQLQDLLAQVGLYTGGADGRFGPATRAAVRSWQRGLGIEPTGVVQLGDIIFVPALPARLTLDEEQIRRGVILTGGEDAVLSLGAEPEMTVPVTATQAAAVHVGTTVRISGPGGESWVASVSELRTADDQTDLVLAGPDGGSICGEDCGSIPVGTESLLRAEIVLVEPIHGSVVPTAALISTADGSLVVIDREGEQHPVTVLATAKGMSVVRGVTPGLSVRITNAEAR